MDEDPTTLAVNRHGAAGIGAAKSMEEQVKGLRTRTESCLDDAAESLAVVSRTRRPPVVVVTKS